MRTQRFILLFLMANSLCKLAGESVIVIIRPDSQNWSMTPADKLLVNGKQKVRILAGSTENVSSDEYKKANPQVIGSSVLRMSSNGYLLVKSGAGWSTVAPDAANVKGTAKLAELWSAARFDVIAGKGEKGTAIPVRTIFAIVPSQDASQSLAEFLADESNFTGTGEKDASSSFQERMSLLVAVAKSPYGGAPALKTMLLSAMNTALQKTANGTVKYEDIEHGLLFAHVSADAFPNDPQQKQARNELQARKAKVDRLAAILRALNAGQLSDALIEKYSDFEMYDNSFKDIRALRDDAVEKSVAFHVAEANRLDREKQYQAAMDELKIAILRKPSDKALQGQFENVRLEEARVHAGTARRTRVDPNSPEQTQLRRHLRFAKSYTADKKFSEAEDEIHQAELIDKTSPLIYLTRAEFLAANLEFAKALDDLDHYDRSVAEQTELEAGEDLREKIQYAIRKAKQKDEDDIKEAEDGGDFVQAYKISQSALVVDKQYPSFLFHAGLNAAILRKTQESRGYLNSYLEATKSLTTESARRAQVMAMLPVIEAPVPAPQGSPNWMSGYNSAPGLLYCPISLAFNAKPAEVKGSHKLTTIFTWNDRRLESVRTAVAEQGGGESTVYFDYFREPNVVRSVSTEPFGGQPQEAAAPRFTTEGTKGPGKGVYLALFNHPVVSPYMIEKLTKKRVGTIVAGNPYFHPFVWDGVHVFVAEYDAGGHVLSAEEILSKGARRVLDLKWEGDRLLSITDRGSGYKREMSYTDSRLTGEVVQFRGKSSKIEYKYRGDKVVEAKCEADASLDNRSRTVTFRD